MSNSCTIVKVKCAHCGKNCKKSVGHVNRAKKVGLKLFCNQKCFGLSRRLKISVKEKKRLKAEYDKKYREKNEERLKDKRKEYFKKDYAANPEKYKKKRQRKYKDHLKYLQRPEYKQYKKKYDEQYHAKNKFGDYWEAAIALKNLDNEIDYRESKKQNKIYNKSTQKRKRSWQKQLKQQTSNLRQLI
jgi:hypothetical protein